ncbi:MAG: hypothetical protein Q9192_002854 [Flavoplaca navasiana]
MSMAAQGAVTHWLALSDLDFNVAEMTFQKLHEQGPKDANLRAFLVDYAQCKNSRLEGLFQSMVACSYFEPPSTTQYWAPRNVLSNGQDLEGLDTSKSPTFSQALNQFRLFLRQGDPGCVRFWSEYHSACITHQLTQNLEVSSPPPTIIASNRKLLASKKSFWQRLSSLNETTSVSYTPTYDSKEISLELSSFAHAPRFEGAVYTYLWRPHTLPPKKTDAQFFINEDDEGSQDVVINLGGWDHSTGSLDTYKRERLAGPPGYTRPSSNIRQEL